MSDPEAASRATPRGRACSPMRARIRVDPGRLQRRRGQRVPGRGRPIARVRRQVLCVTADSPSYPRRHRDIAERIAREFQPAARVHRDERDGTARVPRQSVESLLLLQDRAVRAPLGAGGGRGFSVIADGSNADDRGDYRPGRQAAREFGVKSPLDEAGLTKAEIRELSRRAGLPTWDEPASACLSSRIPYQSEVTVGKLSMIEQAEEACASRFPRVPRAASRHGRAARNWPRRDGPRVRAGDRRGARQRAEGASATSTSVSTSRATGPAA